MDVSTLPQEIIIGGVAIAPVVSIIISILKGWLKIEPKYIPVLNIILGAICVVLYGIIEQGMTPMAAVIMTIGAVFGSQVFHETFGHAGKLISGNFLGKS